MRDRSIANEEDLTESPRKYGNWEDLDDNTLNDFANGVECPPDRPKLSRKEDVAQDVVFEAFDRPDKYGR